MIKIFRVIRFSFLFLLGGMWCSVQGWGADEPVVVVLGSDHGPYQEAYQGFQDAFGRPVPSYPLSSGEPRIPKGTRIVVAFGGKAALYSYPSDVLLIYCLAPGTKISHADHPGGVLEIQTAPTALTILAKYKEIQPSLKRLAVIWAGDSAQDYIAQRQAVAEALGVDMLFDRVKNPDDLPDHLRALKGAVDAIWMPPDAYIVSPKSFATIKEFSIANQIPFYAPSDGLVEMGAVASVSSSFRDIGMLAGQMAKQALARPLMTDTMFPGKFQVTVNLSAAKGSGLQIPAEASQRAWKVIQ